MNDREPDAPLLPVTPVPAGPREPAAPPSPFTPAARWVAERQSKAVCLLIAILSPVLSLALLVRGTARLQEGIWTYSVDGAGTIHYGPVTPADARSALFREILLQAAQAYFTRNPTGLSYPEVARRIFVNESWRQLETEVRAQGPERRRRNLYDHPEVEGIDVLDEGGAARYRIRGFLVRSGAVEGLPFQPGPGEFHLIVEIAPQADALLAGRYPFVITRHRAAVRWPADKEGS
jgi:hypothetical protein